MENDGYKVSRYPIFKHIIIRLECAKILGHLKIINFPFGTNRKLIILGNPILKHITVLHVHLYRGVKKADPVFLLFCILPIK